MIFGFCSSIQMDYILDVKISKIHENFSLEPILGQEVTGETLRRGPEKQKKSKFFVSNQILGEVYLFLVWVLCDLIFSRNTPQFFFIHDSS